MRKHAERLGAVMEQDGDNPGGACAEVRVSAMLLAGICFLRETPERAVGPGGPHKVAASRLAGPRMGHYPRLAHHGHPHPLHPGPLVP
jgi:hypothetical protein